MLDFGTVLALIANNSFYPGLRQDALDTGFIPGGSPGGVLMQKIPTTIDLVLVYLHDKPEMHHRTNVLATYDGRISQLAVECLPGAKCFAGRAAYDQNRLLVLEQRTRARTLLRSIEVPGLTVMGIDGSEI